MGFEQLLQQIAAATARAQQAAAAAAADRASRREENDLWVTGGVNWNGFGLESLIKMVASKAHPGQLEALANEWQTHGSNVSRASDDLQRSLTKLLNFWGGTAADQAARKVTTNARWIGELGTTAQQMYDPIMDAAGALRSAQDTMPGMPKNNWLSTAGGGAAAGFAVAGPIGAAFGAAIGGIASAFGFGNKKKKMKRKAVQTMQRFETAILGVDQTTPQFPSPSDGNNPGDPSGPGPERPPVGGPPTIPTLPPGGGVVNPTPMPNDGNYGTDPSFAVGPDARWQSLTGLGPGGGGGVGAPSIGGGGGGGLGGGLFPGMPGGMAGRGGAGAMGGRGAGAFGPGGGPAGRGAGAGGRGAGRGGVGGRGGAGVPGGMGAGGRGDRDYRGRGRFSKTGAFGPGGSGGGAAGGRKGEDEEDGQHRRTVPLEEDLFSSDQKAAPPVIGL